MTAANNFNIHDFLGVIHSEMHGVSAVFVITIEIYWDRVEMLHFEFSLKALDRELWQGVKIQMKYYGIQHFIRLSGLAIFRDCLEFLAYTIYPKFIISNQMEEPISIKS